MKPFDRCLQPSRFGLPVLGLIALIVSLTACPLLPFLIPPALEFARNLLSTSSQNYSQNYTNRLETLLMALANTNLASGFGGHQGTVATFAGQQPVPGQHSGPTTAYFPPMPVPEMGQGQGGFPPGTMAPPGYPGAPPGYPGYQNAPGAGYQSPGYPPGASMSGAQSPYGSGYPPQAGSYQTYPGGSAPGYGAAPGYPQTGGTGQGYGAPSYGTAPGYGTAPYGTAPGYQTAPGGGAYGGYPGSGYPAAPGYPTYRSAEAPSATAPPESQPPGASPPAASAPAAAPTAPIGLEVALLRQEIKDGQKVPAIMEDGAVLKDGRGDPQAGDKFKVVFRPDADGYVYVISIDGSGWAQGLFPSPNSSAGNPVSKDQIYVLPEGNNWYSLDQYRGIETIYLVASFQRRPDIEESVKTIAGRERPASAVPQQVTEPAVIPQGFGASAPGKATTIKSDSGQGSQVKLTAFYSRQPNEDLRLTRWFKHE